MQTDNFYILLELSVDPVEHDPKAIGAAISAKQRKWSMERVQNPSKSMRAQSLLELVPEMKKLQTDQALRDRQSAEARKILYHQEKEKFAALDKAIKLISLKGYVLEEELEKLVKKFRPLDRNTIRQRIKVNIKNKEAPSKSKKRLDKSLVKEISKNLQLIGKKSLYEFLEISPNSSLKSLQNATSSKEIQVKNIARKTAEVTAAGSLLGHCLKLFKTEDTRTSYDDALAQGRLSDLDQSLEYAGLDKMIQAEEFDHLLKEAMSLRLSKEEATTYINDYARKKKWSVQVPGSVSVDSMHACGHCGLLNQTKVKNCTGCGLPLQLTCPGCKKSVPSNHRICGNCGFSVGDMANAVTLVQAGLKALGKGAQKLAATKLEQALVFWPGHPEAKQALAKINQKVSETEVLLKQINNRITRRELYAARDLLAQLATLDSRHHALSKSTALEKRIQACENLIKQARSSDGGDRALDFYLAALDEVADAREAIDGVAKSPPMSPSELKMSGTVHAIKLRWKPSPSKGTNYLVVRNSRAVPNGPEDGVSVKVRQCSFDDTKAKPGQLNYYAVFALRKGVSSNRAATGGPCLRLAEVSHLSLTPGDRVIHGHWQKPELAEEVKVWRKKDQAPKTPGEGRGVVCHDAGFTDQGLDNGQTYGYLIVACFRNGAGMPITTNGWRRKVIPTAPPEPIRDLRVKKKGRNLAMSWTPAKRGSVQLCLSQKQPTWGVVMELDFSKLPNFLLKNVLTPVSL